MMTKQKISKSSLSEHRWLLYRTSRRVLPQRLMFRSSNIVILLLSVMSQLLLVVVTLNSSHHSLFVIALQQQSSPDKSFTLRDSNNYNIEGNVVATKSMVQPKSMIVSTKRNGGHTIRYNIIDQAEEGKLGKIQEPTAMLSADITFKDVTTAMGGDVVDRSFTSSSISLQRLTIFYLHHIRQYWNNVVVPSTTAWLERKRWESVYERTLSGLRSTFLPIGYPATVPDRYLSYVVWSSLQDLCTSVRSVIATQRVLQGIGVGTNTATTLSAIQNFILRDAAGMFASLSFTSFTSGIFSKDVKRWRLFADCIVDIGITLEVMAVQLPKSYFVPMLCIANMCKAMCGVAAGATSGSIALYWSSKANSAAADSTGSSSSQNGNNSDKSNKVNGGNGLDTGSTDISDINAKFGAQNTVTGSFGLIFSALLARSVATAPLSFVWVIYSILTIFHMYANKQCMRIIAFPQFNTVRFNHVVTSFYNQWCSVPTSATAGVPLLSPSDSSRGIQLPTPSQVAKVESLFFVDISKVLRRQRSVPIHFGVSFNEYIERCGIAFDTDHIKNILLDTKSKMWRPYLISIGSSKRPVTKEHVTAENCCVTVAVPSNTNPYTQAQAYFHATLYRRIIDDVTSSSARNNNPGTADRDDSFSHGRQLEIIEEKVQESFPLAWEQFVTECIKVGWDLSRTELHSKGYEISFQES